MNKFDNKVQYLKYRVLKEVARLAWDGVLLENILEIPKRIVPGKTPTMRCCVYKERAILAERVKLAIGGNRYNKKVIQVIEMACEDCPTGGYEVTSACRGCLAHRCEEACPVGAITFGSDQKAHIDKSKCIECGKCSETCPYRAINNYKRPCEVSCKVHAISMGEDKAACIDYDKCISCGACAYQCPFGAITDRSYILDVIDMIQQSNEGKNYKIYAMLAPSVASQFRYATLGQINTAIKMLGFSEIVEVAHGADVVAMEEGEELKEKGFLTSSCCPAFVNYVDKFFPDLKEHVSHSLSPAGRLGQMIKDKDPNAKTVFIGPCTAKKTEFQKVEYQGLVDSVITFEELQALIDSRYIDVDKLPETEISHSSPYGRNFARSGGLAEAVAQGFKERGEEFDLSPISCDGIEECRIALMRASKGVLPHNFIEGMACKGGCIGGAGCVNHGDKNRKKIDAYANSSNRQTIKESVEKGC
ncbi:MAG: 4Fe-4S dicluster domain-containing protein [Clostridiales bacterium]|nr:4Fe-4S dicluster domain-containing protein [Clostridiales bacterium]